MVARCTRLGLLVLLMMMTMVVGACGGDASGPGGCTGGALPDCAGTCNGTAVEDCAGTCNGTAEVDCAGTCNGTAEVDCAGTCNGTAEVDCAGTCNGTAEVDCAGTCNGTAEVDCAGTCNGTAVEDCAGTCNGTAVEDCAGTCNGTAVVDCAGTCNGTAVVDCAGTCNGTAVEDCAGVCGGTAVEDCAGTCNGTAELDCAGVCNGSSAVDSCGVCGGQDRDQDCAGVCFGDARLDCAGTCQGSARYDCAGECNGEAFLEEGACLNKSVDLVFAVDCSTTMGSEMPAIRSGLTSTVLQLEPRAWSVRYALVLLGSEPTVAQDFTDAATMQAALSSLAASCGASEPSLEMLRMVAQARMGPAGGVALPLTYRPNARRAVILATDEDSDTPWHDSNCYPGESPQTSAPATIDPGSGYQLEIDATALALEETGTRTFIFMNRNTGASTQQFGDPALAVQDSDWSNFNVMATRMSLLMSGLESSLQAQLLAAGKMCRTFDVWDIVALGAVEAVIDSIIDDPTCGNGRLDPGEACDDGNTVSGDGCSGYCSCESAAGGRGPTCAAASCAQILADFPASASGIYWLDTADGGAPFQTWCDMVTRGGGWTLVAIYGRQDQPTLFSGNHFPRPGASFYGPALDGHVFDPNRNGWVNAPALDIQHFSIDAGALLTSSSREFLAYVGGPEDDYVYGVLPSGCNYFDGSTWCDENQFGPFSVYDSSGATVTTDAYACTAAWPQSNDRFGLHLLDGWDDQPGHCSGNSLSTVGHLGRILFTGETDVSTTWQTGVESWWNPVGAAAAGALLIR